jgi:hypothetical protein
MPLDLFKEVQKTTLIFKPPSSVGSVISALDSVRSGNSDLIEIDAVIKRSHSRTTKRTQHPVEEGADITDHIRAEPMDLSMDCVISDNPIRNLLQGTFEGAVAGFDPSNPIGSVLQGGFDGLNNVFGIEKKHVKVLERIEKARLNSTEITIVTPRRIYDGYYIEGYSFDDTDEHDTLRFSIDLIKIIKVQAGFALIPRNIGSPESGLDVEQATQSIQDDQDRHLSPRSGSTGTTRTPTAQESSTIDLLTHPDPGLQQGVEFFL